jgi:2-polyprenyl-6-methoxyphenol hydroxylase-like FAD-dependent oxidoreductase
MVQVVVVGAGPAGLTLGLLLAQRGINVKLIEVSRNFQRSLRGEALMPSGLAAIAQMGLADLVEKIPHSPLDAWEFYIENRPIFRVDEPMEAGGQSCTLISQSAFLAGVLERAQQYEGFELIQGVAVQDLLWENDRVSGVKLSDGRTIAADLVVGTDGRNSVVRQRSGLVLTQAQQDFDILWFKLPSAAQFAQENVFYSMLHDREAFGWFRSSEGNLQLGWSWHRDEAQSWQSIDWPERLAANAPDWLAAHFRAHADAIEKPLMLSIIVGCCSQWYQPGVLLLGDAAHPMSPIRAQGINMALRDVIVAVNHLVPGLAKSDLAKSDLVESNLGASNFAEIDAALAQIQADRAPEIRQIQTLQQQEIAQAKLLRSQPILRHLVSRMAPVIGGGIRQSWRDRQRQLRQGLTQVTLLV